MPITSDMKELAIALAIGDKTVVCALHDAICEGGYPALAFFHVAGDNSCIANPLSCFLICAILRGNDKWLDGAEASKEKRWYLGVSDTLTLEDVKKISSG